MRSAGCRAAGAVGGAPLEHVRDGFGEPRIREEEVEEARAGDLVLGEAGAQALLERFTKPLRDLTRRRADARGEQHRGVRRVVAEAVASRALDARRGAGLGAVAVAQRGRCRLDGGAKILQRSHGVGG